jgi:hypothetical protein
MPAKHRPRLAQALTLAAMSLGYGVVQLDVTIVNTALSAIGNSLGGGVSELQWVVSAYTIAFASLILTAGALGDRLGAKRVFMAGFALFTAGSFACTLAPNAAILIAARAVQLSGQPADRIGRFLADMALRERNAGLPQARARSGRTSRGDRRAWRIGRSADPRADGLVGRMCLCSPGSAPRRYVRRYLSCRSAALRSRCCRCRSSPTDCSR